MTFMTAEIVLVVDLAKTMPDLKKVNRLFEKSVKKIETAERQAYAHRDRLRAKFYTDHGRALADNTKRTVKAAEDSAKRAKAAHKRMTSAIKRNLNSLKRMTVSVFKTMGRMAKKAFSTVTRYAKYVAAALLAAGVAAVKMAMDVQDSEDFFNMSMGSMADSTRAWSNQLANSLGLNRYEVRETVAVFNEMTTSMGMNDKAAAELSQRFTQLANDLVSYHPKVQNVEQASTVLQAALTGEREALKRLGYYYSENDVKLKAIEMGYGSNLTALSTLQKMEVNEVIIWEKMANVHGDLARTMDQSKNVFRTLWATIKETLVGIGEKMLPAVTRVAKTMRDWLVDNKQDVVDWADVWIKRVDKISEKIKDLAAVFQLEGFSEGMKILGKVVWAIGKAIIDTFIIIGKEAGRGFVIAFGAELGSRLKEVAEREVKGITGWLIKHNDALRLSRAAIKRMGASLTEMSRLSASKISTYEQVKETWKQAGEVTPKRDKPIDMGWKLPEKLDISKGRDMSTMTVPTPKVTEIPFVWVPSPEQEGRMTNEVYVAAMAEANRWNDYQVNSARETSEAQTKFAKTSIDFIRESEFTSHAERLAQMDELMERKREDWGVESEAMALLAEERQRYADQYKEGWGALSQTMNRWFQDASDWGKNLGDILTNSFDRAADSFADMLMKQEADWKAFGQMFIKELLTMIIKLQMATALKTALGGTPFGGLLGIPVPVPASATGASGGHVERTGFALIHKDEEIIPATGRSGGLVVNVLGAAEAGVAVNVEENPDERSYNVILSALGSDGPMRRAVSSIRN